MSEKKDQLEEILKDQFYREAKQIEEEVGLNDDSEDIPEELKNRMKQALDQRIREREAHSGKVEAEEKKTEDSEKTAAKPEKTAAYDGLSEEDKEALRLGREMLKNQGEEKIIRTTGRKKRTLRRLVALAAVLVLVMAIGMTSFGGPERVLQFVKSSVGGRQVSKVNSSDKNKIIEEEDEEKAYEKIAEEFGIEPVRVMWRPDKMKFKRMELDPDIQVAELEYIRDGKRMAFMISASYGETSWGYDSEDKVIKHYYEQSKNADIEVTEYQTPETKTSRYVAEFEYKKIHYCLTGELSQNEMKKILENLYFMK